MSQLPTMPPGMTRASSTDNPELAASLAKELLDDSPSHDPENTPTVIQRPPSGECRLPGGLLEPDGTLYTDAEVREMTGADEEALAKTDAATNIGRFIQVVLQRCVTRVGKYEPPDRGVIGQLLLGDRDALVLAVRIVTYGKELEYTTLCAFCDEVLDVVFDLDNDIPVKDLENPEERRHKIELRNSVATVRLPIGEDQDAIYAKTMTIPEANTLLLSRCVLAIDGAPLLGRASDAVRSMGAGDRHKILHYLTENQPGPRYEGVKISCPNCGQDGTVNIRLTDLFRG